MPPTPTPRVLRRCWAFCCLCTSYARVQGPAGDHRYTLRVNTACCGPANNCFGATPCRNDAVFDVLDPQAGAAAAGCRLP